MKKDDYYMKRALNGSFNAILFVMLLFILFPIAAYFITQNEWKSNKDQPMIMESEDGSFDEISDNIHVQTGLIANRGYKLIITHCTGCHSAKLVTQNRANREGWESMIRWMQRTQNLRDLGANEGTILDYLSKNYAPENKGRRARLANIEWYELK